MSILTIFNISSMTVEKYNKVIIELDAAGLGSPEGRIYHVAGFQEDGGFNVTDVWKSAEHLDEFGKTLFPILEKNGVTPVEPVVYEVHNIIE